MRSSLFLCVVQVLIALWQESLQRSGVTGAGATRLQDSVYQSVSFPHRISEFVEKFGQGD